MPWSLTESVRPPSITAIAAAIRVMESSRGSLTNRDGYRRRGVESPARAFGERRPDRCSWRFRRSGQRSYSTLHGDVVFVSLSALLWRRKLTTTREYFTGQRAYVDRVMARDVCADCRVVVTNPQYAYGIRQREPPRIPCSDPGACRLDRFSELINGHRVEARAVVARDDEEVVESDPVLCRLVRGDEVDQCGWLSVVMPRIVVVDASLSSGWAMRLQWRSPEG